MTDHSDDAFCVLRDNIKTAHNSLHVHQISFKILEKHAG